MCEKAGVTDVFLNGSQLVIVLWQCWWDKMGFFAAQARTHKAALIWRHCREYSVEQPHIPNPF